MRAALLVMSALVCAAACEPIGAPGSDDGPRSPDSAATELPRVTLRDGGGNVVALPSRAAAATLVTVMDPAIPQAGRYLSRLDAAVARLGRDQRRVARFMVMAGTVPEDEWRPAPGWVALRGPAQGVEALAAAVGVVWWSDADGPAQTFGAAVLDPSGTVRDRFAGLETWTELELTAALARVLEGS